ncbi:MAG: DNA-binding protein [Betaproteobacteria bacterium]|nr:DNA-binding protein [Betaproteobacteria bacterium]
MNAATLPYPQTPQSARRWFSANGVAIQAWANAHGFARFDVVDLLRGKLKGKYGRSHRVAIALGLKPDTARRAV